MNGGSTSSYSQVVVEKLVVDNYSYWKLYMEAYLQGQDLWELIFGAETIIPEDTPQMESFVESGGLSAEKPYLL